MLSAGVGADRLGEASATLSLAIGQEPRRLLRKRLPTLTSSTCGIKQPPI